MKITKLTFHLAPRHPGVANWICITGNGFVESSSDNVLIKIAVNLMQASQRYLWEMKCELALKPRDTEIVKAAVTLLPKWRADWKHRWVFGALMFFAQPGKSESLRVSLFTPSIERNLVNPTNPIRKGRVEDTRKSEGHSVIEWIEFDTEKKFLYSTGNSADFSLVLLIEEPENNFNQERC